MPQGLRRLDDRVLGRPSKDGSAGAHEDGPPAEDEHSSRAAERRERTTTTTRGESPAPGGGDGLSSALAVVWRVSRLVLVALGVLLLAAVAFVLLPANEDNVIVRNVLSLAEQVAGPFRDVFTVDDPDRMRIYNYLLGAVVAFVLAGVVGKLPTGGKRRG